MFQSLVSLAKKHKTFAGFFSVGVLTLLVSSLAYAAVASDDATDTAYSNGWQTGDNGGSNFEAWTLGTTSGDGGQNGHFVSGDPDLCMYANNGQTASATRDFNGRMNDGSTFSMFMRNGSIDSGGRVGFQLRSSSGTVLFAFDFVGGETTYHYSVGGGSRVDTGVGFTSSGFTVQFTLDSTPNPDQATLQVGATVIGPFDLSGDGLQIEQMHLFNNNAGSGSGNDQCFDTFSITDLTYVEIASFTASPMAQQAVSLEWSTATEIDHAGFNVYRSATDTFEATRVTQVNPTLIAAQGSLGQGASYLLVDDAVPVGVWYYFLEDVDTSGVRTLHGPVQVDLSAPTSADITALTGGGSGPLILLLALAAAVGLGGVALFLRNRPTRSS